MIPKKITPGFPMATTATATQIVPQNNQVYNGLSDLARPMHYCADLMTKPFWWTTDQFIRMVMPFFPGEYGQCPDKVDEIVSRIIKGSFIIPSATLTIPLGFASYVPRLIATYLQRENFVYLEGSAKEKASLGQEALTVFSMNTCIMPERLSLIFGGIDHWSTRISQVVRKILEANADVVCLQEVHAEEGAHQLYESLKSRYSHFYLNVGAEPMTPTSNFLNSGTLIATRFKLLNPTFSSFKNLEGAQKSANKGCFDFTIAGKDTSAIAHIFSAHLQPSPDDEHPTPTEMNTRKLELNLILKKMQDVASKNLQGMPILLVGDMNIVHGSQEYNKSLLSKRFIGCDNINSLSSTCTPFFGKYVWTYSPEERARLEKGKGMILDYTLLLKRKTNPYTIKTTVQKSFDESKPERAISDHHAILSEITKT
jgi:exonuclease III